MYVRKISDVLSEFTFSLKDTDPIFCSPPHFPVWKKSSPPTPRSKKNPSVRVVEGVGGVPKGSKCDRKEIE